MRKSEAMLTRQYLKTLTAGATFAVLVTVGALIVPSTGHADDDNRGAQDEKLMIQTGLAVAATTGIQLNMRNKDSDLVGLGSYLVNVVGDCNGCHTADPSTEFAPGGNPYLLPGPKPPNFNGRKMINAATYLGGGSDFGTFGPGPTDIISRNLTPDKTGRPEGGNTLAQFIQILRTGADLDHAHPSCLPGETSKCLSFPFNGALLQVMPWTAFQSMTDHQLTAIYTYLSAIPCVEGGPGEPAKRCH
jgi:hypothetical protein